MLGDTSAANSLVIDDLCSTCNAGLGTTFSATWTASAAGTDIYIANPGGSSLFGGFKFLGHRSFPLANQIGVQINAGTNIEFNGTKICPQGGTSSDLVQISNTVSNWSFIDGDFGVCDLLPAGTSNVGIHVTSSNVNVGRIQDNSFIGVTTPIVWATSGSTTARIEGNLGLDTLVFSVAVSDPITLPVGEVVAITGSGTISTMNGMWSNRKVTIIPQGTINFITGGNICNSATGNNEVPVLAVWNSLNGCWGLK